MARAQVASTKTKGSEDSQHFFEVPRPVPQEESLGPLAAVLSSRPGCEVGQGSTPLAMAARFRWSIFTPTVS